jgi:hypothetical protein
MKSNLITTDIVIKGHNELTLKVGNKYEIHYGIHQGVHEYVGTTMDGEHLFKKTDKVTFSYYSKTSPFEFTRIVKKLD